MKCFRNNIFTGIYEKNEFFWLFTPKIYPASEYAKKDAEKMQSKIYQNYIGQFRDKGNVIAEPMRVVCRGLGLAGRILSGTGLSSFNGR